MTRLRPSILDHLAGVHALPRGHRAGADTSTWATAHLYEVDPDRNRALVSIYGSDPVWVPALPSTYTGIDLVHVRTQGGRPVLVEGPTTPAPVAPPETAPDPSAPVQPPPPPPEPLPRFETVSKAIRPTWSGTWSDKWDGFGHWRGSGVGHPHTLHQGANYNNSGRLLGLAVYKNQITALGAVSIDAMDVQIIGSSTGYGYTPTVQGSPHGGSPDERPLAYGDIVSAGSIGPAGAVRIPLTVAMREDFRTGRSRGLRLHADSYGGARGVDHGEGMVLRITYTRRI